MVLHDNPPLPPPIFPQEGMPPPPPRPPSPAHPPGYTIAHIEHVLMSRQYVPSAPPHPSPPPPSSRRQLSNASVAEAPLRRSLQTVSRASVSYEEMLVMMQGLEFRPAETRASCTLALSEAPLPCATAAVDENCLDSLFMCSRASTYDLRAYENTLAPSMLLDMDVPSWRRGTYIYKFVFHVPENEEYGQLLHNSIYEEGGKGYGVELFGEDSKPLSTQCQSDTQQTLRSFVVGVYAYDHVCLGSDATNEQIWTIAQARMIKLTLYGTYRQIWLNRVDVVERALVQVAPNFGAPPPSPHPTPPPFEVVPPASPPPVEAPPPPLGLGGTYGCDFYRGQFFDLGVVKKEVPEPCMMTKKACCDNLMDARRERDRSLNAFMISSTGCCHLISVEGLTVGGAVGVDGRTHNGAAMLTTDAPRGFEYLGVAGTGISLALAGCASPGALNFDSLSERSDPSVCVF